jgi:hypothetical protein
MIKLQWIVNHFILICDRLTVTEQHSKILPCRSRNEGCFSSALLLDSNKEEWGKREKRQVLGEQK